MAISLLADGQAISAAIFGWLLLPLVILDYQKLWLPDRLLLILAFVGLLAGPFLTPEISWFDRALGGILGFLALEAIRQTFRMLRHTDGMGGGDPKLFGAIGIWLGWQALPMTLLLGCLLGFAFIAVRYVRDKKNPVQLPFGTFLGVAAFALAMLI